MSDIDRGQVTASAAEIYDAFFVPALFEQWTDVVLNAAAVREGDRVLDVGCGTGALARAARKRTVVVAAVDPNPGMLEVARRNEPAIAWKIGTAERLPFVDGSFDRTVSQFALMFFVDPTAALDEIARVTVRDGQIALAVWDRFEHNVGYARLASLIEQLFGAPAAQSLRVPFELGDPERLAGMVSHALIDPQVTTHRGKARFESLDAWLNTEVRGWTLAGEIDDDQFNALLDLATRELADLANPQGVSFDVSALVVSGPPKQR
ncbi:MAG: class I SAM-dependent methyltransferase [Gemmatimonadaceae bacterium]